MSNNIFFLVVIIAVLSTLTGCDKDKPEFDGVVCGTVDPLNDLDWLHEEYVKIKDQPKSSGIVAYSFDNMTIIEFQNSLYSSNNIHQFKCDGTLIDFVSSQDRLDYYKDYRKNRKEITLLFGTRW